MAGSLPFAVIEFLKIDRSNRKEYRQLINEIPIGGDG